MWLKFSLENRRTVWKRSCHSSTCLLFANISQIVCSQLLVSQICVHSDFAEASEQRLKRIRTSHEIIENVCEFLFCNYSNLVPPTRPGSHMKRAATEKHKELKCRRSLCSWHKFYLWFLLQLRVYNPVAGCSPFLHSMMPKVIIIPKNLQKTKGKEMSPGWTWKIPPALQSIHVQARRECK